MSRLKQIATLGFMTAALIVATRWPAGAQAAPSASPPLLVRMLPLARDLATLAGTATGVAPLATVPVLTVPSNRYFVIPKCASAD
jgi:hypothetical protein